ncbi:MAG: hypothetical protein JXM70_01420 [Pirellulales bacterium]|nr:hypothetical protein [Pirellulales bacterium]
MKHLPTHPLVQGLSFLDRRFHAISGLQSFISATPDMSCPVASPEMLFPGLSEFPTEIFTSMVVADLLYKDLFKSKNMDYYVDNLSECLHEGLFHFFLEKALLPADVDCTAVGLSLLYETGRIDSSLVHQAVDKMLENTDEAGVIKVYFPPCGHRQYVDPVVCVNAMYLFALVGRENEARSSSDFVHHFISSGEYLKGTRYYPSPDVFLYFLFRFVERFQFADQSFEDLLRQRLCDRFGTTRSPLDLAIRVMLAGKMVIDNDGELEQLLAAQGSDGAWPADLFFSFGKRRGFFGCRELTTAFAAKALAASPALTPATFATDPLRQDETSEDVMLPLPIAADADNASEPKSPSRRAA